MKNDDKSIEIFLSKVTFTPQYIGFLMNLPTFLSFCPYRYYDLLSMTLSSFHYKNMYPYGFDLSPDLSPVGHAT